MDKFSGLLVPERKHDRLPGNPAGSQRQCKEDDEMKKLYIIGILAAFLLVAMPAMATDYTLWAGKDKTDVGTVSVTNDASNIYVTFTLDEGWYMNESHVAVAPFPKTQKGNPKVGQFGYSAVFDVPEDEYTFTVPYTGPYPVSIATQADVVHETDTVYDLAEGAWAGNTNFDWKNWAVYFSYTPPV